MMRCVSYKFLVIMLVALLVPYCGHAQRVTVYDIAWDYYQKAVEELQNSKRDDYFDFTALRGLYARIPYYDPVGTRPVEKMQRLINVVEDKTSDLGERTAAYVEYNDVVRRHIGNVDVVLYAQSMARKNPKFGNVGFLQWVMEGIRTSVLESGDGTSLARAYNILTMGEELIITEALNMEVERRDVKNEGVIYYGIYDGYDRRTKKTLVIFVELTTPMVHINKISLKDKRELYRLR